jgi:outer membrane immunogenic protein
MHCKTIALLAVAFALGFAQVASAADMPTKMYTKAPFADPPYSWMGFYAGLNIGGSWGSQTNSLVNTAGVVGFQNSDHINGIIGGGQIGYNLQVDQWVLGLEADFQGSGQKGDGNFFIPAGGGFNGFVPGAHSIAYTDKLAWFGTVRGRVGWAMDRWLPYLTGGWAYGHGSLSGTTTIGGVGAAFSGSQSYSGWTIGGGLEWAFANRWTAKIEYLYVDFGNGPTVAATIGSHIVSGKMTDNIFRAGLNYRF